MKKYLMITLISTGIIAVIVMTAIYGMGQGWLAAHRGGGDVLEAQLPPAINKQKQSAQRKIQRAVQAPRDKQILFGDFHVHTTFSVDAFFISLPMLQGLGAHPPADACDFARFCSGLDFWSINDHAESLTPANWMDTKRSIRQCDAIAGDENDKDLVSFLGWEWTQGGFLPENHYGHKNVILREIAEGKTPARAIAALSAPRAGGPKRALAGNGNILQNALLALVAPGGKRGEYLEYNRFIREIGAVDKCPDNVHVRELPADCWEAVQTPKELFTKLDQWNLPSIVIPHGTAWGYYSPAGMNWDKQLINHDPKRQTLLEIFSGHGNSEEFRDYQDVRYDKNGDPYCPKPHNNYLPSCWQAGEIIRKRCLAENTDKKICEQRAQRSRKIYVESGRPGYLTVPGARVDDWLDAGQCNDCLLPAFNYRPSGSAQYILALTDFSQGRKKRFRMGFMASSDNHNAQPGTGYKEFARHDMTEVSGTGIPGSVLDPERLRKKAESKSLTFEEAVKNRPGVPRFEAERQLSFFMTGGLVAVHAEERSRNAVWNALDRREVYGTSGDRILLWFDLINPPQSDKINKITTKISMGGETIMTQAPSFVVRVAGAFRQKHGCPPHAIAALGEEGIARLCLGECYNPSGERKKITHVDVIRIMPQNRPGENIAKLIKDPWKRLPCQDKGQGCVVKFSDPEFARARRDAVYYVRAHQEPSATVNGDNLRCTYDANGKCIKVNPCHADYRTPRNDECRALKPEVAWSSPIYVDYGLKKR